MQCDRRWQHCDTETQHRDTAATRAAAAPGKRGQRDRQRTYRRNTEDTWRETGGRAGKTRTETTVRRRTREVDKEMETARHPLSTQYYFYHYLRLLLLPVLRNRSSPPSATRSAPLLHGTATDAGTSVLAALRGQLGFSTPNPSRPTITIGSPPAQRVGCVRCLFESEPKAFVQLRRYRLRLHLNPNVNLFLCLLIFLTHDGPLSIARQTVPRAELTADLWLLEATKTGRQFGSPACSLMVRTTETHYSRVETETL